MGAASHTVRNLDSRLRVRLLSRTSRTVSPTDAGAAFAKRPEQSESRSVQSSYCIRKH
ncbi:LysR family transcriptional regulator [Pseudomonas thivervalensis]|uniref:LysR family transcriptional regulator n=1 Tax=Pseudomonas thivervalensis TaxID=86265 RepID=UPI003D6AEDFA